MPQGHWYASKVTSEYALKYPASCVLTTVFGVDGYMLSDARRGQSLARSAGSSSAAHTQALHVHHVVRVVRAADQQSEASSLRVPVRLGPTSAQLLPKGLLCPRWRAPTIMTEQLQWLNTIPPDPRPACAQLPSAVVAAPATSAVMPVTPARRTSAGASSSSADAPTRASGDLGHARLC